MEKLFNKYNIDLSEEKRLLFHNYYNDIIEKNKVMDLTTITEEQQVYIKHFIDSLLPLKNIKDNSKVLDVGAGAGFPGIPLKIMNESLNIVLLDSLNKRINFLNEEIEKLKLNKISAVHSRVEDYAKVSRETFDYVVSRAVAKLNILCEYCLPLVKKGGMFIAYKSEGAEEEINEAKNAIRILGGKIEKVENINLEGNTRNLIYIKKINETPKKYPRGQNKPRLQPIIWRIAKRLFFVFIIVEKSLHLYVLIRVLVNKIFLIYNYDLFKLLIASVYTL